MTNNNNDILRSVDLENHLRIWVVNKHFQDAASDIDDSCSSTDPSPNTAVFRFARCRMTHKTCQPGRVQ